VGLLRAVKMRDAVIKSAMKSNLWQRRAAFIVLFVYCLDLAWKLAHWSETFGGVPWWGLALGLSIRFAFMGFILSIYLRVRKSSQEQSTITPVTKNASLRSMRIVHAVLLSAVAGYAFVADRILRPAVDAPVRFVESFCMMAALIVVIAFGFRRKLLHAANNALQQGPSDAAALSRWRTANILSMVLAVSVALIGVALRAVGGDRRVVWLFFLVSVVLMLCWRPRLDDSAPG